MRGMQWVAVFSLMAAASSGTSAAAQGKPIVCTSSVAPAYSDTGNTVAWYVLVEPEEFSRIKPGQSLFKMFYDWMRATGQVGRWNALYEDKIECNHYVSSYRKGPGIYPWGTGKYRELRAAKLPDDWMERSPDEDLSVKDTAAKSSDAPANQAEAAGKPDAAAEAAERRQEREAEWQAELDKYAAEKAAWEAKIEAQKRAEERQQAEHAAAQEEAAKVKAAHEAKMAAHRRELEEANRRQQEYFAAQRRYALCVGGERKWCEPTDATQTADAGDSSTDTDATTCVSRPVISGNATFEGNTAAMIVNGCETAVDVKICLMREGGWNCGMATVQPQDRWSHSSFKSSGEIFWDARVAGSNKALASPGGN